MPSLDRWNRHREDRDVDLEHDDADSDAIPEGTENVLMWTSKHEGKAAMEDL